MEAKSGISQEEFPKNWECIPYRLGHIPEYSSCRQRVCPASTSSSRSGSRWLLQTGHLHGARPESEFPQACRRWIQEMLEISCRSCRAAHTRVANKETIIASGKRIARREGGKACIIV
jgi:hypothetical protein